MSLLYFCNILHSIHVHADIYHTLNLLIIIQIGESGKSTRELEKTVALLKKVVERVQSENEHLKKAPGVVTNEQFKHLQAENQGLKVITVNLKTCMYMHVT